MENGKSNWKLSRVSSGNDVFVYSSVSTSDDIRAVLYDEHAPEQSSLHEDEKETAIGRAGMAIDQTQDIMQSIEFDEFATECSKAEENLLHADMIVGMEGPCPSLPRQVSEEEEEAVLQAQEADEEVFGTPTRETRDVDFILETADALPGGTDWQTFCHQLVSQGTETLGIDEMGASASQNQNEENCGMITDMESITVGSSVFETDDENGVTTTNGIAGPQDLSYAMGGPQSDTDIDEEIDDDAYDDDSECSFIVLESPCRRGRPTVMPNIDGPERVSRHFKKNNKLVKGRNIPRPAWLKTNMTKAMAEKPKRRPQVQRTDGGMSENTKALEDLKKLERSPRHIWTTDQRIFLCVLNRWYCRSPDAFAAVFNNHYGLDLPSRKVTNQFESYIRLHGRRAFREYDDVFYRTAFNDPQELEASAIGASLRRREQDAVSPDGQAAKAKSKRTRHINKRLKLKQKAQAIQRPRHGNPQQGHSIWRTQGCAIRAVSSCDEVIVDIEDPVLSHGSFIPDCTNRNTKSLLGKMKPHEKTFPSLAFRVWSNASGTFYDDTGFWASLFASQKAAASSPSPLPQNDKYGLFAALANSHLSIKSRGNSAFVSVASSLLQAMNIAIKKQAESPEDTIRLALINLDAIDKASVHWGSQVIRDLKSTKQLSFRTKYQALQDIMVWRHIPSSAIISTTDLDDIEEVVGKSLCLNQFREDIRTPMLAKRLRSMHRTINVDTAETLGRFASLVGLRCEQVSINHVREFVTCLVDGWSLRGPLDRAVALTFAKGLKDVISAFMEGFEQGTKNLIYFNGDHCNHIAT
ncbi:uncharacterized protein EI97DRAFT_444774 [Westerdykella ornata]|uniref:DUF7587 domain-containing protein n=1 Tax=Westerdykella ornata TaxID=318751 RepID=A0A6A6JBQ9_WESOR|nr:uncharacterized protein EI97DRAFT_444774 [Westerdykella ornata]KAF2273725.1 hypothetical protein EI97DRAFT_444774 [Westerdykella ornata]